MLFGAKRSGDWAVESDAVGSAVAPIGSGTVDVRLVKPAGPSPITSADQFTY